jgi:ABC-type lipoprotein export system ATPase subunit
VIVTHDMMVAADADRIVHVRDGLIQYEEPGEAKGPASTHLAARPAATSAERMK